MQRSAQAARKAKTAESMHPVHEGKNKTFARWHSMRLLCTIPVPQEHALCIKASDLLTQEAHKRSLESWKKTADEVPIIPRKGPKKSRREKIDAVLHTPNTHRIPLTMKPAGDFAEHNPQECELKDVAYSLVLMHRTRQEATALAQRQMGSLLREVHKMKQVHFTTRWCDRKVTPASLLQRCTL